MHVITAVGDRKPKLMQARRARQHLAVVGIQRPCLRHLVEQPQRGRFHPPCLVQVDAVAVHQRRHRSLARVVCATAAEHVVEHAFAQRGLAHCHPLQAQRREHRFEHQHAAGDDRSAVGGEAWQVNVFDALRLQQPVAQQRQRLGGDCALGQLHRRADLADRLVGARRSDRLVPAETPIAGCELLELGGDFGQCLLPALA